MNGGQEPVELTEVEVEPTPAPTPQTGRIMLGALVVMLVAAVGAYFAASADDSTEVDVAAPEAEVEDDAADDVEAPVEDEVDDASDADEMAEPAEGEMVEEAEDFAFDAASDVAIGFGGPGSMLFADGEFVRLDWAEDGMVAARSADGLEWTSEPTTGLPAGATVNIVVETADGFAAVVEVWPEFDEEIEDGPFFGPGPDPERMLATSPDMVTWTTTELPEVSVPEGGSASVVGIAASGDQVAILHQIEPAYVDETQVLFENGYLTEADFETFCGSRWDGPGSPFIVMTCDFEAQDAAYAAFEEAMEAAGTDEERAAIEEEFFSNGEPMDGESEAFRIEPGDPGYDELLTSFTAEPSPEPGMVLSGPIGGPFVTSKMPTSGWANGIAGNDAGFMVIVNDFTSGSSIPVSSTDGVTWTSGAPLGEQANADLVVANDDTMVTVVNSWDNAGGNTLAIWTTTDLGATWTNGPLDSALFGAYGSPAAGPAGFAIWIEGSTEPFPEGSFGPESLTIDKDGFSMELDLMAGGFVLTDAEGTIVHKISDGDLAFAEDGIEGVIRFEGDFQETLVWLDPETGEDLVAFTQQDFDRAFEDVYGESPDVAFEEPPRASELWFSADGETWTLLESGDTASGHDGWSFVAGVGDDEVLVRSETFTEPPEELWAFEMEGRDPTDAELAALDAWHAENYENNVTWRRIAVG